jgi:phosphoadenosine phosphosulfate reductase
VSARRDPIDLELIAVEASQRFVESDPLIVLEWAAQTFGRRLAVTSSMTDAVVPHLVSRVVPGVDVLFLDTGYHFAETIGTRDAIAATLPVQVIDVRPELTVAQQDRTHGRDLFARDPDRCCALRKVAPLRRALRDYDAWVTGVRRDDGGSRRDAQIVEWDASRQKVKINPIVAWSDFDVDRYVDWFGLVVNPLVEMGFPSIGCAPCTRQVAGTDDTRAGRWAGSAKTECGIHL